MSHFAKVVNGVVVTVIVAEQDFIDAGYAGEGPWVQTSYNTHGGVYYEPHTSIPAQDQSKALRKNYASIGGIYDSQRDAFIAPKPYPSWVLNEQTCIWEPPVAYPAGSNTYVWNESTQTWDLVTL